MHWRLLTLLSVLLLTGCSTYPPSPYANTWSGFKQRPVVADIGHGSKIQMVAVFDDFGNKVPAVWIEAITTVSHGVTGVVYISGPYSFHCPISVLEPLTGQPAPPHGWSYVGAAHGGGTELFIGPAGRYGITLQLDGYAPARTTVTIPAGDWAGPDGQYSEIYTTNAGCVASS